MSIRYQLEPALGTAEFRTLLVASTLGARRPVDDVGRLDEMLRHADLIVTARDGDRLVGVARALTDFSYCCYLADLAVDAAFQRRGIGRQQLHETHAHAGERTTLLLVAAPAAAGYYPHVGLQHVPDCWAMARNY